jgi:hypothetical protein
LISINATGASRSSPQPNAEYDYADFGGLPVFHQRRPNEFGGRGYIQPVIADFWK